MKGQSHKVFYSLWKQSALSKFHLSYWTHIVTCKQSWFLKGRIGHLLSNWYCEAMFNPLRDQLGDILEENYLCSWEDLWLQLAKVANSSAREERNHLWKVVFNHVRLVQVRLSNEYISERLLDQKLIKQTSHLNMKSPFTLFKLISWCFWYYPLTNLERGCY